MEHLNDIYSIVIEKDLTPFQIKSDNLQYIMDLMKETNQDCIYTSEKGREYLLSCGVSDSVIKTKPE